MAQETKTVATAKDQNQRDHIDEEEVIELHESRSFYDRVREQAERFASTRVGQFVIERADKALAMIEDTAKWSLPQDKSSAPLERPLPWAPFLMLIVLLRLTRIWLSVGALMIGNGPISPTDMVYFIQTRRRKLRAIRVHGLKVMRRRQQEVSYGSGKGMTQKLNQWFSRAMCRPGVQQDSSSRRVFVRHSEQGLSNFVVKRPREEDCNADADLTIDQMLAKYANENSEDDSDFVPNEEEEEEESSSSSGESESESGSSEGISSGEVDEVVSQPKQKSAGAVVENGVHKAEEKENDKGKLNITTTSNGNNDKEQADVAAAQPDEEWKSSPGHMSAAVMNTRLYNNTAAAGSPTCFNTSLGTQALLKRASIQSVLAHSTPTTEMRDQPIEEANNSVPQTPETEKTQPQTPKEVHNQNQQQNQQQRQRNHPHQRYRGRNRR
uniref:Jabba, isoform E n=1 Tax=Drosophila melanogaster TaxID=7227 RepID=B7YZK4_DROME|nr:jabba, isoform E [Drosophila melanogaster]NP_001188971.1 jabba, isoform G [Drosophila melanogaster]ACL83159.1 jabba, isoform E [Drosophila melanogaster]ADV37217.1 jabba, isoform G [Drosophila melanogaster]|eukprot:NP_001137705.1 jabba, isoform E [Drosophila melanogaster]